jgi:hypothetical protein
LLGRRYRRSPDDYIDTRGTTAVVPAMLVKLTVPLPAPTVMGTVV